MPAGGKTQAHDRQGARASALEPVHQGNRQGEVAGEACSHGDYQHGGVEAAYGVDPAECDEAEPENDDADLNHGARTEPVDQPAERRAEQGALDRLQSRAARQGRLAPAALFGEHRHVGAEGLQQQARVQELDARRGGHHPPAMEDFQTYA